MGLPWRLRRRGYNEAKQKKHVLRTWPFVANFIFVLHFLDAVEKCVGHSTGSINSIRSGVILSEETCGLWVTGRHLRAQRLLTE